LLNGFYNFPIKHLAKIGVACQLKPCLGSHVSAYRGRTTSWTMFKKTLGTLVWHQEDLIEFCGDIEERR